MSVSVEAAEVFLADAEEWKEGKPCFWGNGP